MKRVNDSPKLTAAEMSSALWQELAKHLATRLAAKRAENDQDKDATKTAYLRGYIACLKEFLALAETPPPEPEADESE
jgi:hypothetical protein